MVQFASDFDVVGRFFNEIFCYDARSPERLGPHLVSTNGRGIVYSVLKKFLRGKWFFSLHLVFHRRRAWTV